MRYIGLIQLDLLTFMPMDCFIANKNFYTTLLLSTLTPLIVFAIARIWESNPCTPCCAGSC